MILAVKSSQQSLEDRFSELTDSFKRKTDELSDSVNTRLDKLDSSRENTDVVGRKRVEEKMDVLIATVKRQKTYDHQLHDCVQEAVQSKLEEDQQEIEEIKKRNGVIIHGLQESTTTEAEAGMAEDGDHIIDLLHQIRCDEVSVTDVVRLGKKPADEKCQTKTNKTRIGI